MASQYLEAVRLWVEEGFNRGTLDVVEHVFAQGCVSHNISSSAAERRGPEAEREWISATRAAFPDFHVSLEDTMLAGDKVIVRWLASGTQRGMWMGISPTGRHITWGGITFLRLMGSKIQECWVAADTYHATQQLGGMALAAQAGAIR